MTNIHEQFKALLDNENDEVVFNAGSLEKSIFMKMEDYFRIANPQIANIAIR